MTRINHLEEKIKNLWAQKKMRIKTSTELDRRILHDAVEAFEVSKKKKTVELKPGFSRRMIKNKLAPLAVSVVVVICVVLGIYLFRGSGVAWAKVAQKVEQMETCQCRMRITPGDSASRDSLEADELVSYMSKNRGVRLDKFKDNILESQMYILKGEKSFISISHKYKKYSRVRLKDDMTYEGPGIWLYPREYLKAFLSGDYKQLKRKIINGIEVSGIEVKGSLPLTSLEGGMARLWVDIATDLPVRLEYEGIAVDSMGTLRVVQDYRWDVTFADNMFKPDIPDDYSPNEQNRRK